MKLVEILIFLIEFIGVSAILYLIYILLLRYKCHYNIARAYLILTPIVAIIGAASTFNVIPHSMDNIQSQQIKDLFVNLIEEPKEVISLNSQNITTERETQITLTSTTDNRPATYEIESTSALTSEPMAQPKTAIWSGFNAVVIATLIYLLIILIRTSVIVFQIYKIRSIKRWATKEVHSGVKLHRSALVETPFSFMRDIFIDRFVYGDKLNMIIQHELSHINNRHYLDKNISELICLFMWYNPIVWLIRSELGAIHEFQADNNVIKNGANIKKYQIYLFEEILSKSPIIANGFNHSLIKKRMIMMKNREILKHFALRASIATVALISAFVLVSFKYAETYTPAKVNGPTTVSENLPIGVSPSKNSNSVLVYDQNKVMWSYTSTANKSVRTIIKKQNLERDSYMRDRVHKTTISLDKSSNNIIATILLNKKTRKIEFIVSGDKLPSDSDLSDLRMNLESGGSGMKEVPFFSIMMEHLTADSTTTESVPQEEEPKKDIILSITKDSPEQNSNNNLSKVITITEKDQLEPSNKVEPKVTMEVLDVYNNTLEIDNIITPITVDKNYTLLDNQINNTPDYMIFNRKRQYLNGRVIGIETSEDQTLVDFIIKPHEDKFWWAMSERTYLVDHKAGLRYKIRGIEGGIPLGKVIIINDRNGQDLCFTLIFPPLGEKVKKVDFIELVSEILEPPTTSVQLFSDRNLDVKDLKKIKMSSGKVVK